MGILSLLCSSKPERNPQELCYLTQRRPALSFRNFGNIKCKARARAEWFDCEGFEPVVSVINRPQPNPLAEQSNYPRAMASFGFAEPNFDASLWVSLNLRRLRIYFYAFYLSRFYLTCYTTRRRYIPARAQDSVWSDLRKLMDRFWFRIVPHLSRNNHVRHNQWIRRFCTFRRNPWKKTCHQKVFAWLTVSGGSIFTERTTDPNSRLSAILQGRDSEIIGSSHL